MRFGGAVTKQQQARWLMEGDVKLRQAATVTVRNGRIRGDEALPRRSCLRFLCGKTGIYNLCLHEELLSNFRVLYNSTEYRRIWQKNEVIQANVVSAYAETGVITMVTVAQPHYGRYVHHPASSASTVNTTTLRLARPTAPSTLNSHTTRRDILTADPQFMVLVATVVKL